MARGALLAALASLQVASTCGAGVSHLQTFMSVRGTSAEVEVQLPVKQESSFLERNFLWLSTLPYVEGRVVSLVSRMDLSKVFPDAKVEAPKVDVPKRVEVEVPKVTPIPGTEQAKLPKELEAHAPKNPLVNQKGNVEVDADKLAASHPVVDKDGQPRDHTAVIAAVASSLSTIVLWFVFVLAAAFIYRNTKDVSVVDFETAKAKGNFKDQDFKHGPFDCCADTDVCCWSFWCGAVQWSDTVGAVGSLPFWAAFAAFIVLGSLNFLFGLLFWPIAALIFTYYRQDLRRKFELQNENVDMAKDFGMWCCCFCCAIVQEARQVKEARQVAA